MCQDLGCCKDGQYFCDKHEKIVCFCCKRDTHYDWEAALFKTPEEVLGCVDHLTALIIELNKIASSYDLLGQIGGLETNLDDFSQLVEDFGARAKEAVKDNKFTKFHSLINDFQVIKTKILKGGLANVEESPSHNPILRLLFDSLSKKVSGREGSLNEQNTAEEEVKKSNEKQVVINQHKDEIDQDKETHLEKKEEYKGMLEELNSKIEDKEIEIQTSKGFVEDLTQKATELEEKFKETKKIGDDLLQEIKSFEDFKDLMLEVDSTLDSNNELRKKLKEKEEEFDKNSKLLNNLLNPTAKEILFKSVKGTFADFDASYKFNISMNICKEKELLDTFANKQLRLSDIKRVFIENPKNEDSKNMNKFLISCIPTSLPLLCLSGDNVKLINGSELIDGICNASELVTNEIYLNHMEFKWEEIQRIFRSAIKTQRLIFRRCKLHTTDDMDFNTDCALTHLSFVACSSYNVSMKWDEYPERFENIVKAISKSNFKDSLTTINIYDCSISASKVKEQLSQYNISHINVVQERDIPLHD